MKADVPSAGEGALRVLHVSQVSAYGGLTNCVADYLAWQVRQGFYVIVACPPGHLQSLARECGATVVTWRAKRDPWRGAIAEVRSLRRLLAAHDPDVVHLHSSKAGMIGRLAVLRRRPTVFSPHAWSFNGASGVVRRMAVLWERVGARLADLTVCVSEEEREEGLRARVFAEYAVLPNAVDLSGLLPEERDQAAARSQLAVTGEGPLVVCVGRLCQQKGQDVLLDAWRDVLQQLPSARLVLVGDGPDERAIMSRLPSLPGVALVGVQPRETALRWIVAADALVLPSRYEGMSLVLLEAQALGTPVVSTDVAGAREVLGTGAGVVVPCEDPSAMSQALVDTLARVALDGARPVRAVDGGAERLEANVRQLSTHYRAVLARRGRTGGSLRAAEHVIDLTSRPVRVRSASPPPAPQPRAPHPLDRGLDEAQPRSRPVGADSARG